MKKDLTAHEIGCSYLDRYPLIMQADTHLTVALPSALSVATRNYAIASIIEGGLSKTFDDRLARNYAKLFSDTPLLGGPTGAPVRWKTVGEHRWSNFYFKVDEGYNISYHIFLPSVQTHANGGFKTNYQVEDTLFETLQKSIDNIIAKLAEQPDFKEGLVILVGCGWGKGGAIQSIALNHPKWRFQSMSAADLLRLSWLGDMSPSYFWRIQDGLEAVTKAGVKIVNPNGILNLIGWVRSNDGHFVPHAELPDDEVSPERPLMLNLPLNLLRDVRADVHRSYDRHRTFDNAGTWHDVQRALANSFSHNESSSVYISLDDLRSKILTSVYEGALRLWISIATPNITPKEVEYQLWKMANEWLHRIGAALDAHAEGATETLTLKVCVEFRDVDPPKEVDGKPTQDELIPLCTIEAHSEPNACKAVFGVGFLSGFLIAENVAERLFVRNLVRAFLHLLGVENGDGEAEAIEARVVQNNEARSFHFFHAQKFTDHVRDTLPKELIPIDLIDYAAAKIGMGWHVIGKDQGNRFEGPEVCTNLLAKIVDVLLDEIIDTLSTFDRLSTLKRLVANCEKARAEEDNWKLTSAAILGLHGRVPGTVDRVVEQMSKFAGAAIASRILSEIALCACPSEGAAKLSSIEMSKLIARAALVVSIGGLSDAIYYNALAPEIKISPLGDILFRDEFGELVVEPMLSRIVGDRFITHAPLQKKNYENPEIVPDARGKISDEFWDIWKTEMGFDLNEARKIIDALEDKGIAGLPELLNRNMKRDWGDIDVLAWRSDRNQVLVIECKDLSQARNYSEIAALLSDYQGVEVDGDADRLKKHLNRVSLLQENQEQLQRVTNIQRPQIVSCLVCSGVVPMQYAKIDALADTHVGSIEKILAL